MFERFTESARQVIVLAQEESRLLRHNYIGTEHFLLGLLREEESIAGRVLESLGITLREVRAKVVKLVGQGDEIPSGQIPFTPHSKKVLELALNEANSLGHNYIGTEHLLLGLLREAEGVANEVLSGLGTDAPAIGNAVLTELALDPAHRSETYRARLAIVDAYLAAAEHRDQLLAAIGEAETRESAQAAVETLLDVPAKQAEAVLALRLLRFSRDEVLRFEQERDEIRAELDRLEQAD